MPVVAAVFDNFHEVLFPTTISYPAKGGPSFSTQIQTHQSGHEARVAEWQVARGEWEVGHLVKTEAQYDALLKFFYARKARFYGFLFKDFSDFRANPDGATEITIGEGNGTETQFQLNKTYSDAAGTYTRNIYKPTNNGTFKLYKNGALQATPAQYSISYTTGVITFVAAPGLGDSLKAYFEFYVPVRFKNDKLEGTYDQFNSQNWQGIGVIELRPR